MKSSSEKSFLQYFNQANLKKDIKRYILPFSPYQGALFLFDILVYSSSLYTFFYFFSSSLSINSPFFKIGAFSIILLTIPMLLIFPIYRLYSYHVIYRKRAHLTCLFKAYLWVLFSYLMIYFLYNWPLMRSDSNLYDGALILLLAFVIAVLGRLLSDYLAHLVLSIGAAFVTVGCIGFMFRDYYPHFIIHVDITIKAILLALAVLTLTRYFIVHKIFNNWLRRYFRRDILIIGEKEIANDIIKFIIQHNAPFWVNGLVRLRKASKGEYHNNNPLEAKYQKKILGDISELPIIIDENNIQEIIIADKSITPKELIPILDYAVSNGIVAWFPPFLLPIIPMKLNIDDFCGMPMIRMCIQRNPAFFMIIKRMMDLILAISLVTLLSPVLAIIAIAIKLDSKGPVLYKAKMVGENGKYFEMYKFRSMRVDGDSKIHKDFVTKFIKGEITRGKKSVLKITNDPRVTRVGRIIRRLSLDELPQLFNVIKGDMSLVGPRPCLPYEYELYKDWHRKRNSVRPGITGLWQIAGRSEVSFEEMILLDLYYIYNRNTLMDLAILFETIFVVLGMEGAY